MRSRDFMARSRAGQGMRDVDHGFTQINTDEVKGFYGKVKSWSRDWDFFDRGLTQINTDEVKRHSVHPGRVAPLRQAQGNQRGMFFTTPDSFAIIIERLKFTQDQINQPIK